MSRRDSVNSEMIWRRDAGASSSWRPLVSRRAAYAVTKV